MRMEISEKNGAVVLKEVFNPITLVTDRGEELTICMRDSGFAGFYKKNDHHVGGDLELKQGVVNYETREVESLPTAIQKLAEHLVKDEEYFESWKANIAMSIKDELASQGWNISDGLHLSINDGAARFLENFTHEERKRLKDSTLVNDKILEFLSKGNHAQAVSIGAYCSGRQGADYLKCVEFSEEFRNYIGLQYTFEDVAEFVEDMCERYDLDYSLVIDYLIKNCDFLETYRENSSEAAKEEQDDSLVGEKEIGNVFPVIDWKEAMEQFKDEGFPPSGPLPCSFPPQPDMEPLCEEYKDECSCKSFTSPAQCTFAIALEPAGPTSFSYIDPILFTCYGDNTK
jgi:uncharacterized protein YeeX (DUF496 family)